MHNEISKMISVNTICTNIITTLDILPTIANICDEEIDHDVDGVDIFSILDSSRHNLKDLSYIIPQAESFCYTIWKMEIDFFKACWKLWRSCRN